MPASYVGIINSVGTANPSCTAAPANKSLSANMTVPVKSTLYGGSSSSGTITELVVLGDAGNNSANNIFRQIFSRI